MRRLLDPMARWLRDPSLRVADTLTPGQRYTFVIASALVVSLLVWGPPDDGGGGPASSGAGSPPVGVPIGESP